MANIIESLFNRVGYQKVATISEADRKAALQAVELANKHLEAARIRKQAAGINGEADEAERRRTLENTRVEAVAAGEARVIAAKAEATAQAETRVIIARGEETAAAEATVTQARAQAEADEIFAQQQRVTAQNDTDSEATRLSQHAENERNLQQINRESAEAERSTAAVKAQTAELNAEAATNEATAKNAPKLAEVALKKEMQANSDIAAAEKTKRQLAVKEFKAKNPQMGGGGWKKTKLAATLAAGVVAGSFADDFTRESGGYRLIDFGGQYEWGFQTLVPVNDTTQTQAAQKASKLLEDTLAIGMETQGQEPYTKSVTRANTTQAKQMACLGNSFASAIAVVSSNPGLGEDNVAGLAEQNATAACFNGDWEKNSRLTGAQIGAVQQSAIQATRSLGINL